MPLLKRYSVSLSPSIVIDKTKLIQTYANQTFSVEITATNYQTNSNATSSINFVLCDLEPHLSTQLVGLAGAIVLALFIILMNTIGSHIHQHIELQREDKQIKRYMEAISMLYCQTLEEKSERRTVIHEMPRYTRLSDTVDMYTQLTRTTDPFKLAK